MLGCMGSRGLTCIEHGYVQGDVRARACGGGAKVTEALSRLSGRVKGDDCVLALAVGAIGKHDI